MGCLFAVCPDIYSVFARYSTKRSAGKCLQLGNELTNLCTGGKKKNITKHHLVNNSVVL